MKLIWKSKRLMGLEVYQDGIEDLFPTVTVCSGRTEIGANMNSKVHLEVDSRLPTTLK